MEIRFYAGAADAAGSSRTTVESAGLTAAELLHRLGSGNEPLAAVLPRCSLLVDGSPVHDPGESIPDSARVDVLPPFAGG